MSSPQIVWLRRDLRLADQPAFHAAAEAGPVIPVYILDDDRPGTRKFGGAHRWWLHHSLRSLADDLEEMGSRLILRSGDCVNILVDMAGKAGAGAIHALRHYEHWWRTAETELADALPDGCELILHDGNYLLPPGEVTTGSGTPYKIYTPFAKATIDKLPPRDELPAPDELKTPDEWPSSDELDGFALLPTQPDWSGGFAQFWQVGESAAHDRLHAFEDSLADYDDTRNLPSQDGSSRLSPHLHWGEISPVQVWHAYKGRRGDGWTTFEKELIWRDFTQEIIAQYPQYPEASYRAKFTDFPWRYPDEDEGARADLKAWQQGRTGYPIVDAGMRQLWHIGWMHNRVRMITASFLIKHLLIDWREGERWFWDCLVDGDYANNGVNWQWVSGTGVDSSMFSRIMAPLSQSEKFDAAGYIREWVPELADLSDAEIHDPSDDVRPRDYPEKLIAHDAARERALDAYAKVKGS